MFKNTILLVSLSGLVGGSVHADSSLTIIKDNVNTIRRSLDDDADTYNTLSNYGVLIAFAGCFFPFGLIELNLMKPWNWDTTMITEKKLAFYENAEAKMENALAICFGAAVCGTALCVYSRYKCIKAQERATALRNISNTVV